METIVFFIRHGESMANEKEIFQGWSIDTGLTEAGKKQAMEVKKLLEKEKIDSIYCSPKKRCLETAEIIFGKRKKIFSDDRLQERGLGEWEGISKEEVKKRWPENFEAYQKTRDLSSVKGAELYEKVGERIKNFFEEILKKQEGKKIAVISHGGIGKTLVRMLLNLPREMHGKIIMGNASLTKIVFNGTELQTGKIIGELGNRMEGAM